MAAAVEQVTKMDEDETMGLDDVESGTVKIFLFLFLLNQVNI